MKKFFLLLAVSSGIALHQTSLAQNKMSIIYEDNSANKGKVEWTRTMEINDAVIGEPKKIKIPVKNISNTALNILTAKTHCGCIEATPPKDSIAPGATGYIDVVYTAKPRNESVGNGLEKTVPTPFSFYQIIDVTTNFDRKNSVLLNVQGTVIK
jgi:hypothetical protein